MWTEERIEALKTMWDQGRPASEIAKNLGYVSRSAVIGKAHRLKLARRVQARSDIFSTAESRAAKVKRTPPQRHKPLPIREVFRDLPTEPLPPVDTMPAQVSFNKLQDHHCRAIVAEHLPFDGDRKIYCGERKVPGKVYCACHVRRYENAITPTAATRAVVTGHYRAPGKNFGVGEAARVNEFLTETA